MTTKKKSISTVCSTLKCDVTNNVSPYAGKRGVTRIHVNQRSIRANTKNGTDLPIVTVKRGKQNLYGHIVEVDGPSVIVYSPNKPLSCGARVWVETLSSIRVIERTSQGTRSRTLKVK